jgi:hypothetical protein
VFAKAADRRRHLALKRLPPHLPIGNDFQTDIFLQRDGVVNRTIFDLFKLCLAYTTTGQVLLCFEQLWRPEQASDDISMNANHKSRLVQNQASFKHLLFVHRVV